MQISMGGRKNEHKENTTCDADIYSAVLSYRMWNVTSE
jgi:hypothetical protein